MKKTLYPHQKAALNKLSNGKILQGGVGSGKTLVAVNYYIEQERSRPVYVITTARKRDSLDWEKEFAPYGIGKAESVIGGQLIVDSWNNLKKYTSVHGAFFIFDEQRLVGSGSWTKAFLNIARKNQWILLSATPGDTWMDYIPVFVANGFYKNRTQFKLLHVVYNTYSKFPKVDHYVDVGILMTHRKNLLVEMPYVRHTERILHMVDVGYDVDKYAQVTVKKWNIYEDRPIRGTAEAFSIMRRLVGEDITRVRAAANLIELHPKIIFFYNFDYEREILLSLCGTLWQDESVTVAEWSGHKHEPVPDTDRWVYLAQYTAASEAWNCIDTNIICFYSLNYSYKVFEQASGRTDRINTPYEKLHYYLLKSGASIDDAVWNSLKQKKRFNESNSDIWCPK